MNDTNININSKHKKGYDIYDAQQEGIDLKRFIEETPRLADKISPEEAAEWNKKLDQKQAKGNDLPDRDVVIDTLSQPTIISSITAEDKYSKLIAENSEVVLFRRSKVIPDFDPRNPKPANIRQILSHYFNFRYNVITGKHQFCLIEKPDKFIDFNDRHFNTIRSFLLDHYLKSLSESDLRTVIESDFAPDYNPIIEYFENVTPWTVGMPDYIKQLASLVTCRPEQFEDKINPADIFYEYLSRWLTGCVACMLGREENHQTLTLVGPQGIGKNRFLRKICISPDLVYVGSYNPGSKDSKLLLVEKVIIVLDELEATTKYELAALKSDITKNYIDIRRPYGRRNEQLRRIASFAAASNDEHILSDLTGSRRWNCVLIDKVNYEAVTPELIQHVWAQALYYFNIGKKYWYDVTEIPALEQRNEQFYQPAPEEEALFSIIYPNTEDDLFHSMDILTNTEILAKMNEKFPGIKMGSKRLSQVLKKYNYERMKRADDCLYGYKVRLK